MMAVATSHEIHNRRLSLGVTTSLLVLCYSLYFLRVLSRKLLHTALWIDDWFMLFSLIVCTGLNAVQYVGIANGSGFHREHLPISDYRNFMISLYIYEILWSLAVATVKIGILLFYFRIFTIREFRRSVMVVGAIVLTTSTALFITFIFQCHPIRYFWRDTEHGTCVNQVTFYMAGGIINIASDILVLSLPIRMVWNLKASVSHRLALLFLFCLGGFVCITSVIRVTALHEIDENDFTYSNLSGGLWTLVEVDLGFICANLPHTRPLAIRLWQRWMKIPSANRTNFTETDIPDDRSFQVSKHRRLLRQKDGFQNLDAQENQIATKKFPAQLSEEDITGEEAEDVDKQIGDTMLLHEITSSGMPSSEGGAGHGAGAVAVKVETEIRQDVRSVMAPPPVHPGSGSEWAGNAVSTKISAQH